MIRKIAFVGGPLLVLALLVWGGLPLTNRETNPAILVRSALAQSPGETAGSSQETVVETYEYRFSPSTLTVTPGTRVTWVNRGQGVHAVTSFDRSWDSGPIAPGDRWSLTFTEPGTFPYYCHPGMEGRVIVGDVPAENVPPSQTPESGDPSRGWVSPPQGIPPAGFDDLATIMDRMMGGGMMGGFAPASPSGTAPGNRGWGGMMGSGGMMGGTAPSTPDNGWRLPWGQRGLGGMMGR